MKHHKTKFQAKKLKLGCLIEKTTDLF